jgi:hypothetical protein
MKYLISILFTSHLMACDHCDKILMHMENQYEIYRNVLECDFPIEKTYIEGKADAYREMTYFLEPYIY